MMAITRKISRLTSVQKLTREKLNRVFSFRLATGAFIVLILASFSVGMRSPWLLVALLAGILVFLGFLSVSRRLRRHMKRIDVLIDFYERQGRRLTGQPPTTPQPRVVSDALAADLDFFGPHSVLSQIDETVTDDGRSELARRMMRPKVDRKFIENQQRLVRGLSPRAGYLRRLIVIAGSDLDARPTPFSKDLLESPLVEAGFERRHLILWLLFAINACAIAISALTPMSLPIGATWLAFFVYSMYTLGKSGEAFTRIQGLGLEGERLAPIFRHLEKLDPKMMEVYLPRLKANPLSRALKRIESLTAYLSVQTHPLVAVLVNGILPWSYFFAWRAEKLRQDLSSHWPPLMTELHEFEVMTSLALLHRYQTKTFPEFVAPGDLRLKAIRHPLIALKQNVPNDFELPRDTRLILITGSNMSGKSTFLRTLGVNQTLALMGAPVFAEEMRTPLARPLTCIRVSDSVRDGVSYFYAETLRLKAVLEQAAPDTIYLIDEMFRGTNNRERLIGSQSVVAALIKTDALGIVTTHDLELTNLERNHRELTNWHFSDDLDPSGLKFSYKIHRGPCPSTNALRIMRSLGLPVEVGGN